MVALIGHLTRLRKTSRKYTIRTPQRKSPQLSARLGANVELKLEMQQHSGSFKTRGAFHQMLALGDDALGKGVVAVSGGNFARAVGYCSGALGLDAIVCMPENAPPGIHRCNAQLRRYCRAAAGRGRRFRPRRRMGGARPRLAPPL